MMKYLKKIMQEPEMAGIYFMELTAKLWPAKWYIKFFYYLHLKEWPDLDNPRNFNEKLNWLKLHDHNPLYTRLADKCEVKKYVAEKIGSDKVVPLLGVWNHFDEIDFDKLPDQFILKCTHDSGSCIVCDHKQTFDKESARTKLERCLQNNFYWNKREWVYKDVPPRIIAEQFLNDGRQGELQDYKFWCFNGEPRVVYITNKGQSIFENFYDMDFSPLDINHGYPRSIPEFSKPNHFDEMKLLAKKLSKGIPFVRVDFFLVDQRVFFGEFTFYDWAGFYPFTPPEWNDIMGDWLELNG